MFFYLANGLCPYPDCYCNTRSMGMSPCIICLRPTPATEYRMEANDGQTR